MSEGYAGRGARVAENFIRILTARSVLARVLLGLVTPLFVVPRAGADHAVPFEKSSSISHTSRSGR